jgi:hypothetical protein
MDPVKDIQPDYLPPIATGAWQCFDSRGHVIDCDGSGQDGEYRLGRWHDQRFVVDGDNVLDRLSGLTWSSHASPLDFPLTWVEAMESIQQLNRETYLGYDDWRLPNRRELSSLINYARRDPALPENHPLENLFIGWYWSSTTAAIAPDHAWYVHTEGGRMFYGGKDQSFMVWPVRGQPLYNLLYRTGQVKSYLVGDDGALQLGADMPSPRFEMDGDEAIVDHLTGLRWYRHANLTGETVNWAGALDAIKALRQRTRQSWRLPNINELESLVDCAAHTPALPACHPFKETMDGYWSSTSSGYEPDWAFALYMHKGAVGVGQKKDPHFYAWPVCHNYN